MKLYHYLNFRISWNNQKIVFVTKCSNIPFEDMPRIIFVDHVYCDGSFDVKDGSVNTRILKLPKNYFSVTTLT